MPIIPLFKYERTNGGITVSPVKPEDAEYTEMFRLVADEGKVLTKDGVNTTTCTDVESSEGWYEIEEPVADIPDESEATEEDYINALEDLGVNFDG